MTTNRSFATLGWLYKADGLEIHEVVSHPVRSGGASPISGEWRVELGCYAGADPESASWLLVAGATGAYRSVENWRDRSGCANCRGACKGDQDCQVLSGKSRRVSPKYSLAP